MQSKVKLILLLLTATMAVFSCSKEDAVADTPPVPVPPVVEPVVPTPVAINDTLGVGWQRITVDTTLKFYDIFFVNNQIGFLCASNYIGKSTDGGLTWKKVNPASITGGFANLYFTDENNGWVFGGDNFFARTKDGGASWQQLSWSNIFDGQFFDADNGYVAANNGSLYRTSDGGVTLQRLTISSVRGLFFLDKNRGWCAGLNLTKTIDAGLSFKTLSGGAGAEGYAVQFTDSLHGWVAGPSVYRTEDGGNTLQVIKNSSTGGDIYFADNNNGFIMCGARIYSTTDAGKTLNVSCTIRNSTLYEIHFTDLNHGWATGDGGYVYRYVKP